MGRVGEIKSLAWRVVAIIPAALILCVLAQGQGTRFENQSLPLAINIEGRPVRTELYLQADVKMYGQTLEQFGAQQLDPREKLFLTALRAIRANDYEALRSIWKAPAENPKASANLSMGADPKTYLEAYSSGYGNFQDLKILFRMELGPNSLFVWGAKAKTTGMFFPDGLIVQAGGTKLSVSPATPSAPVANLIIDTMLGAGTNTSAYPAPRDLHLRYKLVLPLDATGRPGQHLTTLEFDGTLLNFNAFEAEGTPPNPVLAFYREAFMEFKNRSFDDFVKRFTTESQKGVKTWVAGVEGPNAESYFKTVTTGKYVKFLLNADPVYLVFYTGDKTDKWIPGSLHYDYVVRDTKSGAYKLANFGFNSSFDDILRDQSMFNQQVFRLGSQPTAQQAKKGM